MVRAGARQSLGSMRTGALAVGVVCAMMFMALPQPASAASVRNRIDGLIRTAIVHHGIRAVILQATADGRTVLRKAYGQSMTGVPATTNMHFRNGAVAISYMSTLLLRLVDQGKVKLDDKVSRWLPSLRDANRVTLGMLAGMTAGYHDYALDPLFADKLFANPFGVITTSDQLRARARRAPAVHARHELELLAQQLRDPRTRAREDHEAAVERRAEPDGAAPTRPQEHSRVSDGGDPAARAPRIQPRA